MAYEPFRFYRIYLYATVHDETDVDWNTLYKDSLIHCQPMIEWSVYTVQ